MTVNVEEIVALLCTLAEEERLRVTVRESLKGGLIAGGMAVAGGLVFGPIGIALGGTLGGCVAAIVAHNRFLPLSQVLATMEYNRRTEISMRVQNIMNSLDITDAAVLGTMIAGDINLRNRVIAEMVDFVRTEAGLALV